MKDHASFFAAFAATDKDSRSFALLAGRGVSLNNPEFSALVQAPSRVKALDAKSDLTDVFGSMNVFVMSSAWGEGFPNVVAEAMMHGVPCIVTDVGDAADVVGDTGWVVPPRNSGALSRAMLHAQLISPDERRRRGEAARDRIRRHFSISGMVAAFERVWRQADESARMYRGVLKTWIEETFRRRSLVSPMARKARLAGKFMRFLDADLARERASRIRPPVW
jgi:glycosyltransferase involved in cell wall biosynthesis